jgi:hypothetical protein
MPQRSVAFLPLVLTLKALTPEARDEFSVWQLPSIRLMQKLIESAVEIFRSFPDSSDEEILTRIIETGVERSTAVQLVALLPLAYGRLALSDSGVVFPDVYICLDDDGEPTRKGSLSSLPLWDEALNFARKDKDPSFPIASRSPEVRAANAALHDATTLSELVWGPPVFQSPASCFAASEQHKGRPWWWRQIWIAPTEHSVTPGERSVARVVMIIALLIGLFAIAIVVYYAASLLREPH